MKLLIRATNWVGDAILALPALRAVRKKFPDAAISVLARPYVADIYRGQGIADELIAYDHKGVHAGFLGREKLLAELRARKFDVALLLQNAFDAAWLAWRAGIPERVGYARDGRSFLLTKPILVPKAGEIPTHEKFYYLELLRRAGWLESLEDEPNIVLSVDDRDRRRALDVLLQSGARANAMYIAIGAGASYGSAKCWLPERFAEVANRLQDEWDADVILFGTAGEAAVSDAVAAGVRKSVINLTGRTTVAELPALLSQCHLFIGNDSGAMHVAAAVGLPVVAIFGPTDPCGTAPVTPRSAVVQDKVYCSPCFLRRCPTDHRCMKSVNTDRVLAAIQPWMATVRAHGA
jgi:heptosyltransferase II